VSAIGEQMLHTTQYGFVLPFEVVSMLLLAAMVGCIVIAMKATPKEKGAQIEKQVDVNPPGMNGNGKQPIPLDVVKEVMEEKTT